jgi:hypothetical protein
MNATDPYLWKNPIPLKKFPAIEPIFMTMRLIKKGIHLERNIDLDNNLSV